MAGQPACTAHEWFIIFRPFQNWRLAEPGVPTGGIQDRFLIPSVIRLAPDIF